MVCELKRYCKHGKQRNHCKECGDGSICKHDDNNVMLYVTMCGKENLVFDDEKDLLAYVGHKHDKYTYEKIGDKIILEYDNCVYFSVKIGQGRFII